METKEVTGDTPLMLRHPFSGEILFKVISELGENWTGDVDGEVDHGTTEYQAWSDKGWTDIKRVIRSRSRKQIYHVLTDTGYIKVSKDNVMLTNTFYHIKPAQCDVNTKLLSRYVVEFQNIYNGLDNNHAYMCGVMLGDQEYLVPPPEVINGPLEVAENFITGFTSSNTTDQSDVCLAGLYHLYKKTNKRVKLHLVDGTVTIVPAAGIQTNKIRLVEPINYMYEYIYSIETEVGRFQAGVGDIII